MRYAKISPEGDYQPPPPANAKAAYATMVYVRATIVEDAGWVLARATTIAVSHITHLARLAGCSMGSTHMPHLVATCLAGMPCSWQMCMDNAYVGHKALSCQVQVRAADDQSVMVQ